MPEREGGHGADGTIDDQVSLHFNASLLLEDWAFAGGARPGEVFPDFDLPTVAHGRVRSAELLGRRPLFM